MSNYWYERAQIAIRRIDAELPSDATRADAEKALHDGYPFGERAMWPYKQWLKARKDYLKRRFDDRLPVQVDGGLFSEAQ